MNQYQEREINEHNIKQYKEERDLKIFEHNYKRNDFFTNEMIYLIRKINHLSKSKDNKYYIMPLIWKLRRIIFSRKINRKEAPLEKYHNLKEKKHHFKKREDGTYDMHSNKKINFNKGFQVSFETNFDSYSHKEYDEIAYKMSLMSDNHFYLGVYDSTPEMSFYFHDFELANVISIIFNQKSIWDWVNNDEIINQFHEERKLF